ncbi:MAG: C40 family peptidase [Proteobacteria bacterium]|nr:C40 family peptidase [Pseudomonadota bacterium]
MKYQVTSPITDVREVPDANAVRGKFETQLVFGEIFIVGEEKNGWCKGMCRHDQYPGYVERRHLTQSVVPPTHIVTTARTHTYQDASIKSPLVSTLGFGSLVTISASDKGFAHINNYAWVYQKHIAPITPPDKDYLASAKKFLGTPYYWGGRSGFGIDCSGLVQVCLGRAGMTAPRDTEEQQTSLGVKADLPCGGDLVFFPGHVGIMTDDHNIIHANAFHMEVTIEPLDRVTARSGGITAIRQLKPLGSKLITCARSG